MPKLIKDGAIVSNEWQWLTNNDEDQATAVPEGKVIVPLAVWLDQKGSLSQRDDVGVWLENDQLPSELGDDVATLPLIAVNFPGFMDGRGFSIGRLLRDRYGFKGELRAYGNIIRDQLTFLSRCGFNAFDCREAFDLEASLASLSDFSESYQAAVDKPMPLFRRRA